MPVPFPRGAWWCLGGLLSGCVHAASDPLPLPQALWDAMVHAHGGGQVIKDIRSAIIVREISGDVEGTSTLWLHDRGRRETFSNAVGERLTISDERGSWTRDLNGWDRVLKPGEGGPASVANLFHECPLFLASTLRVSLGNVRLLQHDGAPSLCLDLNLAGADAAQLFLDPGTTLLRQVVIASPEGPTTYTFSRYERRQGLAIPMAVTTDRAPGVHVTATCLSLTLDTVLPSTMHERPPSLTGQIGWPTGEDRVRLPARILPNEQVAVRLELPGRVTPVQLLLDSGAASSMVAPGALAGLSLPAVKGGRIRGVGTKAAQASQVRFPSVSLGSLTLFNRVWAVHDGARPFDGLAGYDIFRGAVIDIAYTDREVWATRWERYQPRPGAVTLDCSLATGGPTVVVLMNGGIRATLLVDLGSNGDITLFRPFVRRQGWAEGVGGVTSGVGGSEQSGSVQLTLVELGKTRFPPILANVVNGMPSPNGLIGVRLLSRLASIAFDYERGKLYMTPKAFLGVRLDGARMRIVQFLPHSPAEAAGLRVGDLIVQCNDRFMSSLEDYRAFMARLQVGETVNMSVERAGSRLTVPVTTMASFQ